MNNNKMILFFVLSIFSGFKITAGSLEKAYKKINFYLEGKIEKAVNGDFKPVFSLELVDKMSSEQHTFDRYFFVPEKEMRPLVDNALKRINDRIKHLEDKSLEDIDKDDILLTKAALAQLVGMKSRLEELEKDSRNVKVSVLDIVLAAHWSNGWTFWYETYPPKTKIGIGDDEQVGVFSNLSCVLYDVEDGNYNKKYDINWSGPRFKVER